MTKEEKLNDLAVNTTVLDDLVIDAASEMASDINNRGATDQLEFLRSRGYTDEEILQQAPEDEE